MARNIFSKRKHGIDMPEWMWNLVTEGKIRTVKPSNTAYITHAIIEQAKRDGFWKQCKALLDQQRNKLTTEVANGAD